ncbi:MAG: c-type cytochrome [Sphingomonadales bacterium]|nr:MAG: c-type cytochrome [Sphingomonadales bacterium]
MKALVALPLGALATSVLALTGLPSVATANQSASVVAETFAQCRACHTLTQGGRSVMGPNLFGVFGRKAGSLPGFAYSPALKASGMVWDARTLDAYLAAPTDKVPGTRMIVKVADPARRAALIAYLKAETK